jgi:hypothetical protein
MLWGAIAPEGWLPRSHTNTGLRPRLRVRAVSNGAPERASPPESAGQKRLARPESLPAKGWITGFEPATSGTTIRRSNQLSYIHRVVPQGLLSAEWAAKGRYDTPADLPLQVSDEVPGIACFPENPALWAGMAAAQGDLGIDAESQSEKCCFPARSPRLRKVTATSRVARRIS